MTSEVDNFLEHYGVKGMKWGVTRASDGIRSGVGKIKAKRAAVNKERAANTQKARAAGYKDVSREYDTKYLGARSTRRIEKRIAGGENIDKARNREYNKQLVRGLAIGGALLVGPLAVTTLDRGAGNLAKHINGKRGAAAAAKVFADGKGLTSYKTFGLAFDAATGSYR